MNILYSNSNSEIKLTTEERSLTFLTRSTNVMSLSLPFCQKPVRNVNFKQFQTNQTLSSKLSSSTSKRVDARLISRGNSSVKHNRASLLTDLIWWRKGVVLIRESNRKFSGDKYGKIMSITADWQNRKNDIVVIIPAGCSHCSYQVYKHLLMMICQWGIVMQLKTTSDILSTRGV